MDIPSFAKHIQTLCETYNGSITSWFRTTSRNKMVGGHPQSRHLKGLAVDIVLDDMSPTHKQELIQAAKKLNLKGLDEKHHIHVQSKD